MSNLRFPDKKPHEVIKQAGFDFASRFLSGEVVSSVVVSCTIPDMLPQDKVTFQGTKALFTLEKGVDGDVAVITVEVTGSLGSVRVLIGEVHVHA